MPDIMARSGLVLEPSKKGTKVNLTIMRGNTGVLFRMVDVSFGHESGVPLGDCVIEWKDLDKLIEKLVEFRGASLPKHYYLDLEPMAIGMKPGDIK